MLRSITAAALSALIIAAAPAVAEAKWYKGKTKQGRAVAVRTGADGVVNFARVSWRAPCRRSRHFIASTSFRPPLDAATGDMLQDGGTYRVRLEGGWRARITGTIVGQRDPATDRWAGTWAVTVKVTHRGRTMDRCALKRATWTAR